MTAYPGRVLGRPRRQSLLGASILILISEHSTKACRYVDATLNGNNARLGVGIFRCHLGGNIEATLSKMCSNSSTGRLLILAMIPGAMSELKSLQSVQMRMVSRMYIYWELDSCSILVTVCKELWWILGARMLHDGLHWPCSGSHSLVVVRVRGQTRSSRTALIVRCKLLDGSSRAFLTQSVIFCQLQAATAATEVGQRSILC